MPLNCSKPPTSLWVVMYIYIYARKYHIWRKSVSLWAMYIYIYIVSPFVHIHTCMYTITTSIQYTYIMCSHPGVDKNIDVPLSDNRFFMYIYIYTYIYIYVCIENTKMDRSFKNPYSIYFRMIVYDIYIYISNIIQQ